MNIRQSTIAAEMKLLENGSSIQQKKTENKRDALARQKEYQRSKRLINKPVNSARFKYHQYTLLNCVGNGKSAVVMQALRRSKKNNKMHEFFAVKVTDQYYVKTNDNALNQRRWHCIERERQIMEGLNSPYVIKFVEFIEGSNYFYLVQELANGGNLKELLKSKGGCLSESIAKQILTQIISGFCYLYDQRVIHRDVKLENLLIHFPNRKESHIDTQNIDLNTEKFVIKIADFGYSKVLESSDTAKSKCGTPLLMAPEVIQNKKYGHKRDVWAIGALYFQLITGQHIFGHEECTLEDLERQVLNGKYSLSKDIEFSLQGLEFLNQCLNFDEDERPSWQQLKNHRYLTTNAEKYLRFQRLESISSVRSTVVSGTAAYERSQQLSIGQGTNGSQGDELLFNVPFFSNLPTHQVEETKDDDTEDFVTCRADTIKPSILQEQDTFVKVETDVNLQFEETLVHTNETENTIALQHDGTKLYLDIYGVRKFQQKCDKAFQKLQSSAFHNVIQAQELIIEQEEKKVNIEDQVNESQEQTKYNNQAIETLKQQRPTKKTIRNKGPADREQESSCSKCQRGCTIF